MPQLGLADEALVKVDQQVLLVGAAVAAVHVFKLPALRQAHLAAVPMRKHAVWKAREKSFQRRWFVALQRAADADEVQPPFDDSPLTHIAAPQGGAADLETGLDARQLKVVAQRLCAHALLAPLVVEYFGDLIGHGACPVDALSWGTWII